MKAEEQNIAIAEVMREHCKCKGVGNEKACNWNCPCGNPVMSGVCGSCCQGYLNDLNACHEMEKVLDRHEQWPTYCNRLMAMQSHLTTDAIRATAAQRCEAFLRTIGKWTE